MKKCIIKRYLLLVLMFITTSASAAINIDFNDLDAPTSEALNQEIVKELLDTLNAESIDLSSGGLFQYELLLPEKSYKEYNKHGCLTKKTWGHKEKIHLSTASILDFIIEPGENNSRVVTAKVNLAGTVKESHTTRSILNLNVPLIGGGCDIRPSIDLTHHTDWRLDVTLNVKVNLGLAVIDGELMVDPELEMELDLHSYGVTQWFEDEYKLIAIGVDSADVIKFLDTFKFDLTGFAENLVSNELAKKVRAINQNDLDVESIDVSGLSTGTLSGLLTDSFSTIIPDSYINSHKNELIMALLLDEKTMVLDNNEVSNTGYLLGSAFSCEYMYLNFKKSLLYDDTTVNQYGITDIEYCDELFDKSAYGVPGKTPSEQLFKWALNPAQTIDIGMTSIGSNSQPYMTKHAYPVSSGDCSSEMRVYKKNPNETNLKPLLLLHGGGWHLRQLTAGALETQVSHYTDAGFVVFLPMPRLTESSDTVAECTGATAAEITYDVQSAFFFAHRNRRFFGAGKPGAKMSIVGESSGAHLAAWLAVQPSSRDLIDKVVGYYGMYDFNHAIDEINAVKTPSPSLYNPSYYTPTGSLSSFAQKSFTRFLGTTIDELKADDPSTSSSSTITQARYDALQRVAQQNSFTEMISRNPGLYPKFFLIHGRSDDLISAIQSVRLCNSLSGSNSDNFPVNQGNVQDLMQPRSSPLHTVDRCDNRGSQLHLIQHAWHQFNYCGPDEQCDMVIPTAPNDAVRDQVKRETDNVIQQSLAWLVNDVNGSGDTNTVYKLKVRAIVPNNHQMNFLLDYKVDPEIRPANCMIQYSLPSSKQGFFSNPTPYRLLNHEGGVYFGVPLDVLVHGQSKFLLNCTVATGGVWQAITANTNIDVSFDPTCGDSSAGYIIRDMNSGLTRNTGCEYLYYSNKSWIDSGGSRVMLATLHGPDNRPVNSFQGSDEFAHFIQYVTDKRQRSDSNGTYSGGYFRRNCYMNYVVNTRTVNGIDGGYTETKTNRTKNIGQVKWRPWHSKAYCPSKSFNNSWIDWPPLP